MSGLIWAGIGKGISDAGASVGSAMMRSVADDERRQERLELQRERLEARQQLQDDRLAQARELQQARLEARGSGNGGGSGGLTPADIGEGGKDEGMIARAAGLTVPELRAARKYSETGDAEPFKRDVTRYGRDQDDGMAGANDEYSDAVSRKNARLTEEKVRELPPGFEQEMRARNKALAKIEESYRLGGKYEDVTKGRLNDQQRDLTNVAVNNPEAAPQVAMGVAAGKGNEMYGGDSNVTRQKFTGQTSTTDVGKAEIAKDNAQARNSGSSAKSASTVQRTIVDSEQNVIAIMKDGTAKPLGIKSESFQKGIQKTMTDLSKSDPLFNSLSEEEKTKRAREQYMSTMVSSAPAGGASSARSGNNVTTQKNYSNLWK